MTHTFYSITSNNGDGSASVQYFDEYEVAEVYQSLEDERFCEDDPKPLVIHSDGTEITLQDVTNRQDVIKYVKEQMSYSWCSNRLDHQEALAKLEAMN